MVKGSFAGQKSVPIVNLQGLLNTKNKSDQQRVLVSIALKNNLPFKPVELKKLERMSLFVPPALGAKVDVIARKYDVSFQAAWAALASEGLYYLKAENDALEMESGKIPSPILSFSPEQKQMYSDVQAGFLKQKITLAEGSTGIGKSWVGSASALTQASLGHTPVIIAAPTLAVLGNLWSEMQTVKSLMLENKSLKNIPSIAFFPGATEFINSDSLIEYLAENQSKDEHERDDQVLEWAQAGGPLLSTDNPLVQAMQSMNIDPAWLKDDLKKIAVNLSADDFPISIHDDCSNIEVLEKARLVARDADIIFCTHAMLAVSQRAKWALVPEPKTLIIDEAHQLESNYANIYSSKLSLSSFRHDLNMFVSKGMKGKTIAQKTSKELSLLIKGVQSIESGDGSDRIEVTEEKLGSYFSSMLGTVKSLHGLMSNKLLEQISKMPFYKPVVRDLERILSKVSQDKAYIEFSPSRRFPSLLVGKSDISGILGALWKTAENGAMLMSATIFVTDRFGNHKSDYFCMNNALPASRTNQLNPFISPWVTSVPTLHTPSEGHIKMLSRPSFKEGSHLEIAWLEYLTNQIIPILDKAKGGTLILATSYSQVNTITKELAKYNIDENRIVAQSANSKFMVYENAFRSKHKQGIRPVLIALGAAWTGVNLKDNSCDPSHDTMLTDLVITCLPIGLNRSCTQLSRIDRYSMYPIEQEALMLFKQGIGRLMRHKDQVNRHLWILDGRIWNIWKGMSNLQISVKRMLEKYKNEEKF